MEPERDYEDCGCSMYKNCVLLANMCDEDFEKLTLVNLAVNLIAANRQIAMLVERITALEQRMGRELQRTSPLLSP